MLCHDPAASLLDSAFVLVALDIVAVIFFLAPDEFGLCFVATSDAGSFVISYDAPGEYSATVQTDDDEMLYLICEGVTFQQAYERCVEFDSIYQHVSALALECGTQH